MKRGSCWHWLTIVLPIPPNLIFAAIVEDFCLEELNDWNMDLPFDEIPTDIEGFFEGADKVEHKRKYWFVHIVTKR